MALPSVSVVVPVFNSAGTLPELVRRLRAALAPATERLEVVFVNDGSRDASWEVIEGLAREFPEVRAADLEGNFGQHNALLCGIRAASCDVVVTMDDDLQNRPEDVSALLGLLAEGHDAVYGIPRRRRHGFLRDFAAAAFKRSMRGARAVEFGGFRAFRARLRESFPEVRGSFVSIDALLARSGSRFANVTVEQDPRGAGRSGYSLRSLALHALVTAAALGSSPARAILGAFRSKARSPGPPYVVRRTLRLPWARPAEPPPEA